MSDIAIKAESLGKAYRLGAKEEQPETLVEAMVSILRAPARNFGRLRRLDTFATDREGDDVLWALKDVSFEIQQGEVVGFIGRNGAGKSTLLKILSRITEPTEGRVLMRGQVSSLLEVGTGFHPELTGRENVYMNGTILGMKKREIDRKFDEIVDFAGVERFLDTPIKRYSSGMKVRLAFSVAAHLEPEVLIIDEVLAVGDADFQKKCLGKMQDVDGHGRTVLFVSHNMGAIQALCPRAISLREGRVVEDGEAGEVVRNYLSSISQADESSFSPDNPNRRTPGEIYMTAGRVLNERNKPCTDLISGEAMTLEFDYENPEGHKTFDPTVVVSNSEGIAVFHLQPKFTGLRIDAQRKGTVRCTLPRLSLPLGEYRVAARLNVDNKTSDIITNALSFSVHASTFFQTGMAPARTYGCALTEQIWEVTDAEDVAGLVAERVGRGAA